MSSERSYSAIERCSACGGSEWVATGEADPQRGRCLPCRLGLTELPSPARDVVVDGVAYQVELERKTDGRWFATVVGVPGAFAYGPSEQDAFDRARGVAESVLRARKPRKPAADFGPLFGGR